MTFVRRYPDAEGYLGTIEWCTRCHFEPLLESYKEGHVCPPEWACMHPDWGDDEEDAKKIFARDAEEAAEKWAHEYDTDDYPLSKGGTEEVQIRKVDSPDDDWQVFVVSAEHHIDYSVHKVAE